MKWTVTFSKIGKNDAASAGGKGASLGEMTQAGIPVPPGFVILADAFEHFLEAADLNQELDAILGTVHHDQIHTVEHASEKIQALILVAHMPKDIKDEIQAGFNDLGAQYVAVRSSATAEDGAAAAWAGQLDTFLNTTEEKFLENVQRCWASLFTPRAIFYRFEKGMHGQKISVAVVIQKMIESESSGIAFSVHPVTEDYNQLIIEAGFGLGEAIVSGQVTPDAYIVEKEPRRIIDTNVSTQTRGLYRSTDSRQVAGAEGNEWKDIPEPQASSQVLTDAQVLELSELVLKIEKHYSFPCDIEWAFARPEANRGEKGRFYITQSRPITTLSKKCINVDMQRDQWIPVVARNYATLHASGQLSAQKEGITVGTIQWSDPQGANLRNGTPLMHFLRERDAVPHGGISSRLTKQNESLDQSLAMAVTRIQANLMITPGKSREDAARIFKTFKESMALMIFGRQSNSLALNMLSQKMSAELFAHVQRAAEPIKPTLFMREQRAIRSAAHASQSDSNLKETAARLAEEFGFVHGEYVGRTWDAADYEREIRLEQSEENRVTHSKLEPPSLNDAYSQWLLHIARTCNYLFDDGKAAVVRSNWALRETLRRLDVQENTILSLTELEFNHWVQSRKIPETNIPVEERLQHFLFVFNKENIEEYIGIREVETGIKKFGIRLPEAPVGVTEIHGTAASSGTVEGIVRRVLIQTEAEKMKKGEILVTSMTTPELVVAMRRAAAIVTDEGGAMSHAAIVARELGIPCIVGTMFATQVLKDGDMVEVDADNGVVRILKLNQSIVEEMKTVEWYQDWSGLYSQVEASLSANAYFGIFEKAVGVRFSRALITFNGDTAAGWLPAADAEMIGTHLVARMKGPNFLEEWVSEYRQHADTLAPFFTLSSEAFLARFKEYVALYPLLAPYVIGTKIAFNLLPLGSETIATELEAVRAYTERFYKDSSLAIAALCEFIAARSGYSVNLTRTLTTDDVCKYAELGQLPDKTILEERAGRGGLLFTLGSQQVLSKAEVEEIFSSFRAVASDKELRGTSAYRGNAKGICRVVLDYRNAVLNDGEILVTPMTNPYFVPLMKKAAAIVTDGGGMLSHAAIVARELMKPCVIGTRFATQILKDGDMVEVDADRGVVRILPA